MQALKMTFALSSLLMLILSSAVAMPVMQKKKTSPSNETAHTPPKSDKQLNFIQKFMLKKVVRKTKKTSDEDDYRKWARMSVIFGVLAAIPILGIFFMIISVVKGVEALKSDNKRTRKLAIAGIVLAVLLFFVGLGVIIHFRNTFPASFCFAGC